MACYYMLDKNVSVTNVSPCIKYIANNVCKREIGELPGRQEVCIMQREISNLAKVQVGETIMQSENVTVHTDGTSKKGHHFSGIQISTEDTSMSLGLSEIPSGTASNYFDSIEQTIRTTAELVDADAPEKVENIIITKCKNMMNDKHVVETKMNHLFEEKRKSVLPETVADWEMMSPDDKIDESKMNIFHCGLHALVNMASLAETVTKEWEKSECVSSTANFGFRNESVTYKFVKAVCNLFHKEGGGAPGQIQLFLEDAGFKKNPVEPFSGSRFNIIFHNGGGIFYAREQIMSFLTSVIDKKNRLHNAILADIVNDKVISACRMLGLVSKLVTGPLWRTLERKDVSVTEMSVFYERAIRKFVLWSVDASDLLTGKDSVFGEHGEAVIEDAVFLSLTSAGSDESCQSLLQVYFESLIPKWERWFAAHLLGGEYYSPSIQLKEQTKSVPKTNTISERDFAQLDRHFKISPNANAQFIEGKIASKNNQTVSWLHRQTEKRRGELIKRARKIAKVNITNEKCLKREIKYEQLKIQKGKVMKQDEKERRSNAQNEKLMREVESLGGLWRTEEEINANTSNMTATKAKGALKSQIKARQRLFGKFEKRELFRLSSKESGVYGVEKLKSNLCAIVTHINMSTSTSDVSNAPLQPSALVGKAISHFYDDNGDEQWWDGKIISHKDDNFVLKYKNNPNEWILSKDDVMHDIKIGDIILY